MLPLHLWGRPEWSVESLFHIPCCSTSALTHSKSSLHLLLCQLMHHLLLIGGQLPLQRLLQLLDQHLACSPLKADWIHLRVVHFQAPAKGINAVTNATMCPESCSSTDSLTDAFSQPVTALLFNSCQEKEKRAPSVQIYLSCVDYIVTLYRLRRPSGRPPDYTTYTRHKGRRTNI